MELRQLQYLDAVVREGSFTRAAERLFVSQPGVSTQIRALERELGQVLLTRGGRSVRPTAAGERIVALARDALARVADMRRVAEEYSGVLHGRLSVATVASAATGFDIVGALAGFRRQHPGIDITLVEGRADELLAGVADGEFDVALVAGRQSAEFTLNRYTVADEALVAAMAPGHPLAGRAAVSLAELAGYSLITFHDSVGTSSDFLAACLRAGVRPDVAFRATDPAVLTRLAVEGLGVAVVPEPYATGSLWVSRIVPEVRGSLELVWPSHEVAATATTAFVRHLTGRG